jgi:hypothetical protein
MNKNHNQAGDGEAKAKPEVIKLSLDLHAQQVTECRQLGGSRLAVNMNLLYVKKKVYREAPSSAAV